MPDISSTGNTANTDHTAETGSTANTAEALRAVLAENDAEMRVRLRTLAAGELEARLGNQEWSVREIVLHVIHAERWLHTQLLGLRRAVAPALPVPAIGGVTLPEPDSEPDINHLLWALTAVREDTLRLLDGLSPAHLREPATLEVDGEPVDSSFRTMLLTAADHQLFHVRQVERTLGRT